MTSPTRLTVLLAVLVGLTAPTASAQIYVDADATGANDGSSWADAYTDLQRAIDSASASSELWIAEGVYTPDSEGDSFTITGAKDGIELYGGFAGTESSRSARDPKQHRTILSGDLNGDDTDPDGDNIIEDAADLSGGENAHHVLVLDGGNRIGNNVSANVTPSTVIDGVVVTAGQADGGRVEDGVGGGLYCDGFDSGNECSPTFRNVVFAGNTADDDGGAIYNDGRGGSSSSTITNATVTGNAAAEGGAIYNDGAQNGISSPTITNATFNGNSASFEGGAIYNDGDPFGTSSPTITNATFTDNSASSVGGAIYNIGAQNGTSSPTITNTILWGNSASGSGDEIYNMETSEDPPVLSHTIIQGGVNGAGVGGNGSNSDEGGNLDNDPQFTDASTPAGPDDTFATRDDGINVQSSSPALDAGTNDAVPALLNSDITGAVQFQDRDEDGNSVVNIGAYEIAVVGPLTATIEFPSSVGATSAELAGTVNPGGDTTTVHFAYRPVGATSFTAASAVENPLTGTTDQSVSASISGLLPDTTYETRVITENDLGADTSGTKTFTTEEIGVALTGGGFGGLDRTFSATPGEANQPVGGFRLTPDQSEVDLTAVSVTPDNPGVRGVDRAALWISEDDQFDVSGDTELASLDLNPQTELPATLTFDGFTEGLPAEARYLFVTVTLTGDASGGVTGYLVEETALSLAGGNISEVNGNSQTGFSNLPLSGDASTLPVEMAGFEGTTTQDGVQLRWRTAAEQDNAGFRVERRVGAGERGRPSAWAKVGFVEGAGTTSNAQTYRFTDPDLPYAADSVAYRLRQVDTDGSTTLTDPVTVVRSGPNGLELLGTAPNPVRSRATVRFAIPESTAAAGATLRLYDVLGREVRAVRAEADPGRHEQTLDVSGLSSGIYVLRLTAGGAAKTRKLTVVR